MLGETIGAYVIERRIGEGGMGTVYVGRHQVMGRRAAIKVLRAEYATDPDMVQRFFNEARAAAAIEHAGIVDVLDVGRRPDGSAYLVMELLEGEPLSVRMRRAGRMPAETAVRITRQIAIALDAAHARGIVHRDLKPDNVFVIPDPETTAGERIKLLDFGIAKLHGEMAVDAPTTRTGALFGTPLYMAPEQCRGAVAVDHRADLYALGCMLYEMLCGRPPFRGPGLGELLSKHMNEAPLPPRELVPDVPASIEAIVLRLLAKRPDDRFATARALVNALDGGSLDGGARDGPGLAEAETAASLAGVELANSETIAAPTDRAIDQASTLGGAAAEVAPTTKRGRPALPIIAAVAAAAIAGSLVATLVVDGEPTPRTRAAVTTTTPDAGAQPLDAARPTPALGLAFLDQMVTATGAALNVYGIAGAWESAQHDFEVAVHPAAPARWRAAVPACAGYAAMLRDDEVTATPLLAQAVALDPTWAVPHLGLAVLHSRSGDATAAIAAAHQAQRLAPGWWWPIAAEARAHRRADKLDLAIEHYRRALLLAPTEPVLLGELALVYHAAHIDTEAVRYATMALEGDPDMVPARLLLAERALERRAFAKALVEADRAVATQPQSVAGHLVRADALARLGKRTDALAAYAKVIALEAETHQETVAPDRLAEIRAALDKGKLPDLGGKRRKRSNRDTNKLAPDDDDRTVRAIDNSPL